MKLTRRLREQFRMYEAKGFKPVSFEPSGHHVKVLFEGIPRPFFITANSTDPRSYLNNLSDIRRLARQCKEKV